MLSLPGLLAACGGGGGGRRDGGGELKDVLNFSNWPFYIDVEGKKHPHLDQFTAETGIKVNYFEDVNSNDEFFAKVQGRLSQGQGIDRDIIVATDNSRFPGLYVDEGWVQPLDKEPHPELREPHRGAGVAAVRPRPDVLAAVALGHGRHRLERGRDRPGDLDDAAARGPEAQGQGDGAERDGGHDRPRAPGQRRRPGRGHRRGIRQRARPRSRPPSTPARSAGSRATTTSQPLDQGGHRGLRRLVGRHRPARPTTRSSSGRFPEKGGIIWTDNMFIPTGGSVPRRRRT